MFEVILFQPEIAPNTGNVIRLCANTGCRLHLIEPLGFRLDDAKLRRAGLDYREYASVELHSDLSCCLARLPADTPLYAFSARARRPYHQARFRPGDALLFGPESRGLPDAVLGLLPEERRLCLPMRPGSRSLNLSNAVAVAVYEAWRQLDFAGAATPG